jgi:hypothetical protein
MKKDPKSFEGAEPVHLQNISLPAENIEAVANSEDVVTVSVDDDRLERLRREHGVSNPS